MKAIKPVLCSLAMIFFSGCSSTKYHKEKERPNEVKTLKLESVELFTADRQDPIKNAKKVSVIAFNTVLYSGTTLLAPKHINIVENPDFKDKKFVVTKEDIRAVTDAMYQEAMSQLKTIKGWEFLPDDQLKKSRYYRPFLGSFTTQLYDLPMDGQHAILVSPMNLRRVEIPQSKDWELKQGRGVQGFLSGLTSKIMRSGSEVVEDIAVVSSRLKQDLVMVVNNRIALYPDLKQHGKWLPKIEMIEIIICQPDVEHPMVFAKYVMGPVTQYDYQLHFPKTKEYPSYWNLLKNDYELCFNVFVENFKNTRNQQSIK